MDTTSTYWLSGIDMAQFQTAGLLGSNQGDVEAVRTWRRQAMAQQSRARSERKRQMLAGFVRGLSDWLHENA